MPRGAVGSDLQKDVQQGVQGENIKNTVLFFLVKQILTEKKRSVK